MNWDKCNSTKKYIQFKQNKEQPKQKEDLQTKEHAGEKAVSVWVQPISHKLNSNCNDIVCGIQIKKQATAIWYQQQIDTLFGFSPLHEFVKANIIHQNLQSTLTSGELNNKAHD